jgi:hypothetical protein
VTHSFSRGRRLPAIALSAAGAALLLAGCDSTVSLPPIPTVAASSIPPTSITVGGALTGPLASPGARCVAGGPAGVHVTIQGTVSGGGYLLSFDASSGTTNLSTTKSSHALVEFAPLQGAGNWGADPSSKQGSGTLVVNAKGGKLDLHLAPGPGSASTTVLDVSGTYGCSSDT